MALNYDRPLLADPTAAEAARPIVPGMRPTPILGWRGNALAILRDPALKMLALHQSYGDVVALARGNNSFVFIFSPEYNHQVLTDQHLFHSLNTQDSASPIRMPDGTSAARLFSGVAGMNGARHTQQRRLMMPAFHKKRIEGMRDIVVSTTEAHIASWRAGDRLDLLREMKDLSLSLAISGLLGLDPAREGAHISRLLERWSIMAMSVRVSIAPFDFPGFPYYRFLKLSDHVEREFKAVIERKRESAVDSGDALAMLIEAHDEDGGKLTDEDLLGHLTTLFTAGHETTAASLIWTLFLLSQHPQVAADLMDELQGVLGGEPPTIEQVNQLPLLEHVINESMRILPPALWFLRTGTAPFSLGPYPFPEGTHLVISPAVTHRNPEIYPQPDRFIPRRWEGFSPSPYEYMPFGAGPRRCLGATFAMLELKLALPTILQRFRLSVPQGARVDRSGAILSLPGGGLPVTLAAQDRRFDAGGVRGNIHRWVTFR